MTISPTEFLALVTPEKESKLLWFAPDRRNEVFTTHEATSARAIELSKSGDVHLALASFAHSVIEMYEGRRQSNVQWLRALWLDIDAGKRKSGEDYPSKKAALQALIEFVGRSGMPEPLVVDSGNGLHAYWPFDRDVSLEKWRPLAAKLKEVCRIFGFRHDTTKTTDAAALLRPVGAINHKYKPARTVRIVFDQITPSAPELIGETLAALLSNQGVSFHASDAPANAFGNETPIDLSLSSSTEPLPIETIAAMGAFVTAKTATKYFATKGKNLSAYQVWLKSTLMPLKSEATNRPEHAAQLEAIFNSVSATFDDGSNTENNATLWRSTKADEVTISTFVAIARGGGYVDAEAESQSMNALIDKFNAEYAFVDTGGRASIIGTKHDIGFGHSRFTYSTVRQFQELHREPFFYVNGDGKRTRTTRANVWLDSDQRLRYSNIAFLPGLDEPADCFNVWHGWGVAAKKGSCELYLNHLRDIICNGDSRKYKTLIQFLAHAVQRPYEKPGYMIVLIGGEGVGKGIAIHSVGAIFGAHYRGQLDSRALIGNFNAELGDALFCFADEVRLTGQSDETERFKRLVTEPLVRIERKGHDACEFKSYHRFVLATNDDFAVRAGVNARRFFVLRVASSVRHDRAYFDPLRHELSNGGIAALHYHLRYEVALADFDPHRAPATEELQEQKRLSLSTIEQWFYDQLGTGDLWSDPQHPLPVNARSLATKVADETHAKPSPDAIAIQLKRLFGLSKSSPHQGAMGRTRVWELPPLTEARRRFQVATGVAIFEGDA